MGGIIDGFNMDSLKQPPFAQQNLRQIKPTVQTIKTELKRRNPGIKRIGNLTMEELFTVMGQTKQLLTVADVEYIKREF